ncbi:sugar phosphate isomerase/epimerase family protein [Pseudomonas gingeri]|uniref:AP endonuclease n=1 Tax=Pseudomonas gingeri TaxID=117681 RepID=A0A7Y8BQG2_9PSED|nr:TIM barrel protein [Pseudomonas gingeri]NWB84123.1 AP endonuclease [Pseudomonas gingeri]
MKEQLFPVSISLSSYGATLVRERGQESFIELLAEAGASRIEVREELLTNEDPQRFATRAAAMGLECAYSSPLELWPAGQSRPDPQLAATLQRAEAFGARWLKVSLGYFSENCDLSALAGLLSASSVRLLVENDQTTQGGRIEPLLRFFDQVEQQQLPVKMTFDIGNWRWQDQSASSAARLLGRHVDYLHCKAVALRADGKLVALPPSAVDLEQWERLLGQMSQGLTRAVEYPLQGDDLLAVTREQVCTLARLGHSMEETAHA